MCSENKIPERPILFSGEMVLAILDGRKTQTRRIVKLNHAGRAQLDGHNWHLGDPNAIKACPYGRPGDRLWVRETWMPDHTQELIGAQEIWRDIYHYRADIPIDIASGMGRWRPSIHMPRVASRIDLLIKDVRTERLQQISTEDAVA